MKTPYDYKKFAVLYVDDEPQALKYFTQAYEDIFTVLTAAGVDEAVQILQRDGDRIGIVITDQRMPQKPGTELLATLRREHPAIIRMLATAYSDLDSAIVAVNSGAIYKYIVKPWDLHELRVVIMRAMEFFIVQRERDLLLREKLGVLQRMMLTDRVKSLTVLAAALGHKLRNTISALQQYLEQTPDSTRELLDRQLVAGDSTDLWTLARTETESVLKVVQKLMAMSAVPSYTFADEVDLEDLFRSAATQVSTLGGSSSVDIAMDLATDLPMFKVDRELFEQMIRVLIEQTASLSPPGSRLMIAAADKVDVWGTPGIRISIAGEGPAWDPLRVAGLFSAFSGSDPTDDLGLGLLNAFFIAHHHGGMLTVQPSAPDGPGFEVRIPFAPSAVNRPTLEDDLMQKLLLRFDLWSQQ